MSVYLDIMQAMAKIQAAPPTWDSAERVAEIRVGSLDPLRQCEDPVEPDDFSPPIDLGPGVAALLMGIPVKIDESLGRNECRLVNRHGTVLRAIRFGGF